MFNQLKPALFSTALVVAVSITAFSQTSWKGVTSTAWNTASNWTNGIPSAATDAVLGDANFTGSFQPTVNASASCKSITIGGAVATTLTLTKNLAVSGSISINGNGTVSHPASTLTLSGNWANAGTYTTTSGSARVIFAGTAQSVGGAAATVFRRITINAGSTTTLARNISASGTNSYVYVYGILDPGDPGYTVTSTVLFRVFSNGKIKVNASAFSGNYILSGTTTLSPGSIVEYSSATTNQTISNTLSYSTLIVSGTGSKTLAGNLPSLNASSATRGNIYVNSGTLDLATYTANRATTNAGGTISVAAGASLKIGGTNTFPANFASRTLSISSTVEYYGTNQSVTALTYGNLAFSSSSGAATKTLPATAFTVEGDFSSAIGSGTSVSYTSASNITFNGQVAIGASTTFNGGVNSDTVRGNWTNNGTFTGSTGTIIFDGPNSVISGSGTQNFNNIGFTSTGITATGSTNINVSGNLTTSGAGQFTHNSGGTFTMTGASKMITGSDIILHHCAISGSVTTTSSFEVTGNLQVSGSLSASAGTIKMSGAGRTISGAGTLSFSGLSITGSVTTGSGFTISYLLDVAGSFTASAGTATFVSSSSLAGIANLFNVTLNGTSLQLSSGSVLGIAGTFSVVTGTLNVTASTPNTVNYNGTGAQSVIGATYHHLTLSNGNTKTAMGNLVVNGNLTIGAATTFAAGAFTHSVQRNWINSGVFTPAMSTVQFTGTANATITGATTFYTLVVNKVAATNTVSLLNNMQATTVTMTSGTLLTGSNGITITSTRSGNGIILGTITRTHAFLPAVAYSFEGPDNTITFSSVTGVSSVTVTVTVGTIADFPNNSAINREYTISVPSGTYTATLRLHYEDAELNGNNESSMILWKYDAGAWTGVGKTASNATTNYIEQSGLTNMAYRWSCDENAGVVRWNGSVSSDWNTAANWTAVSGGPAMPPSGNDVIQLGTAAFLNQPVISNAATAKSISFGSVQPVTLTVSTGGSLVTNGNISGSWSGNATHAINTGSQNLVVGGNLILSNGTGNQSINLNQGAGTTTIAGSLVQTGNAAINCTGAGQINIGTDFNYSSGTFTSGNSTVVYNGTGAQNVAPVTYAHLTINKAAGIASLQSNAAVSGNLLVSSGYLDINAATLDVGGNVTIGSSTTLDADAVSLSVGGNWTNGGTFVSNSGTVTFNGGGAQIISAGIFNNLLINKTAGTASLAGNNSIKGNLTVQSGSLDLVSYTVNRVSAGGTFSLGSGTTLYVGGGANFPLGYSTNSIHAASLVHYNGSVAQTVAGMVYGNLTCSNGGTNSKTLAANATVAGDLTISGGATLAGSSYVLALSGNWVNNGVFVPGTGAVVLNGTAKTVTGNTTFNKLTVNGGYTVAGSNLVFNGLLLVNNTGSFNVGSGSMTVNGDLTNSGSLTSSGTTTFSGTTVQTLRLINALTSTSTGVVNFNGTVSPVMNSTSSPQFATLNVNNTGGLSPSVGWTVQVALNIGSGAAFNGGQSSHYIYGSFANSGAVTSTGRIYFLPATAKTINMGASGFSSSGTVIFGGAGQVTLAGAPSALNNVTISNTHSAGITPPSGWTIDSNLVIASSAVFNAGAFTYTVGGDMQSDGTLNAGTSTFVMTSSSGELTASTATSFYHFTVGGNITPLTDFRVTGNFTNNGVYDGSIGVLVMSGPDAAAIGGTAAPCDIDQVAIDKSANTVVTLNTNVSNVSFLNISGGVLFTSNKTITQNPGGGILLIGSGATLRLGGTNSLPGFSGYGLDYNSYVDYAGTGIQSVGNAAEYGNLLFTTAPTKNAFVPVLVHGNLLVSAGTLATSTVTVSHSIEGDFIMTGGALTGTASTYIMKGTADQTLALKSDLVSLTVNKPSGTLNLGSNVTVNSVTSLLSGKVNLDAYDFAAGPSGTITNYTATRYFIAAGNGRLLQTVAAGTSRVFPVGLANAYTPATISLTAGSATDVFHIRLLPEAYTQGDAGTIVTSNAVRATWLIGENTNGGSDATVTLQWPSSLELSGFNRSFSRLSHYYSGAWEYGTADIAAAGADPYTVTRSGFTGFSPFAVSMFGTLPVVWLNIAGNHESGNNHIYWSTASEEQNNYFDIEASTNGTDFITIGRVAGSGTVSSVQHYSFVHYGVTAIIMYYRIRQVDLDGKFSYSRVVRIQGDALPTQSLIVAPNPVLNTAVLIFSSTRTEQMNLIIYDQAGRQVYTKKVDIQKGTNTLECDMARQSSGTYFVILSNDAGSRLVTQFVRK